MSSKTNFHTTEDLLVERKRLHELVDFFWQKLPYTRDEIYDKMSDLLGVEDAHISDMTTEQIQKIAAAFQKELEAAAPCYCCLYRLPTSYGIMRCQHKEMRGAYWNGPVDGTTRCKHHVPVNLSAKRQEQSGS